MTKLCSLAKPMKRDELNSLVLRLTNLNLEMKISTERTKRMDRKTGGKSMSAISHDGKLWAVMLEEEIAKTLDLPLWKDTTPWL